MDDVELGGLRPFERSAAGVLVPTDGLPGHCGGCKFSLKTAKDVECRRRAPQITHIPVPVMAQPDPILKARGAQAVQQFALQIFTSWPVVRPDHGCHEFEPKPEIVS